MPDFMRNWPGLRVGDIAYIIGRPASSVSGLDASREDALVERYLAHCAEEGREPKWTRMLRMDKRNLLRFSWFTSDYFDPFAIIGYRIPLGFACAIELGGIIERAYQALGVYRLRRVRQLGFLHDPISRETYPGERSLSLPFEHTRSRHSIEVAATATLMGWKLRLSRFNRAHLAVAAIGHDTLTPAGGDTTKGIDPTAFDEDRSFGDALKADPRKWREVRRRYDLREDLLIETVNGVGGLGFLLDIADKLTYVAHDVEAYLHSISLWFEYADFPEGPQEINELLEEAQSPVCGLWNSVVRRGDSIYFTSPAKLERFLRLRALLFKYLYYRREARYLEHMVVTLLLDLWYSRGEITRAELLEMCDTDLEDRINRALGDSSALWLLGSRASLPAVECFETIADARRRQRALLEESDPHLSLVEVLPPNVSDKALRWPVLDARGLVRPFEEALSEAAARIRTITADATPVRLYHTPVASLPLGENLAQRLLERQRELVNDS